MPRPEDVLVDAGDRSCVQLLLELRKRMQGLAPGTRVRIRASDPAAPLDLPAWCHLTGHEYLGETDGDGTPCYVLRVAAAPRPTDDVSPWKPAP